MALDHQHKFRTYEGYHIEIWNNGVPKDNGWSYSIRVYEELERTTHRDVIHTRDIGIFTVPQGLSTEDFLEQVNKGIEKMVKKDQREHGLKK